MRGIIRKAFRVDTTVWIIVLTITLGVIYLALNVTDAYADLTVEDVENLLEEQRQLEEDLLQLKKDLETNQKKTFDIEREIKSLKTELRLLDTADADDTQVIARENVLLAKINELKKSKLDRVDMLAESSEMEQRINVITNDIQFNVKGLETEEVKLVSPDKINLQINIKEIKKQIKILDELEIVIDEQIYNANQRISDFQRISDEYQRNYDRLDADVKKTWDVIAKRNNAKVLSDNMKSVISGMEGTVTNLESDKAELENQHRTLIHVLESAEADLAELESDTLSQRKLVGLVLAKSCTVLIKNNFPTNCPTYEDLAVLDSSNTLVSGSFVYDDDGFYHREEPKYQNSWNWYKHDDEIRLIVDPSGGLEDRIPTIIITNNLGIYTTPEDRKIGDDNVRQYREGRYIENCWTASVSDQLWGSVLTDTVNMLRTGCTETTYNEIKREALETTEIDITTSPFWQYTQWLNETKNNCKTICKEY